MSRYFVESYPSQGRTDGIEVTEFDDVESAMTEVSNRLGREIMAGPDWMPDPDMAPGSIPGRAIPRGGWNESDEDLCGGVCLWEVRD